MQDKFVGKFVAVVPPKAFATLGHPKQMLLMFDCLAIDLGQTGMSKEEQDIIRDAMPEISWLAKSDLLTLLSGLQASNAMFPNDKAVATARQYLNGKAISPQRFNALLLRKKGIDAVPVMSPFEDLELDAKASRDCVVRLTLREFPVPSDQTPWEDISAFKKDPNAIERFHRLKRWVNTVGEKGLKVHQVTDELQGLISDYEQSMLFHKIKRQGGLFEVIVTTTAGIAEDIVKLKISSAAERIFKAQKQDVLLLEDERNCPGKEVGYIFQARKAFR